MDEVYANRDSRKDISETVYVLKALAIICVVSAHCSSYSYLPAEHMRALLGTVGVPVFLMCSGYYCRREQERDVFWKKKLRHIVVPWLLWGIMTYIQVTVLTHEELYLEDALRWIVGYKTWLYFVPVLLVCFVIYRISLTDWWLYFNIVVSLCSWLLTFTGILGTTSLLTPYQNPLNFSMFFALGILLKRVDLEKIVNCSWKWKLAVIAACCAAAVFYALDGSIGYWASPWSIPFELLMSAVLFFAAYALRHIRFASAVGKETYFIFFSHMTIGLVLATALLWDRLPAQLGEAECLLVFVKPITTVLICACMYAVIKWLAERCKCGRFLWIIGC